MKTSSLLLAAVLLAAPPARAQSAADSAAVTAAALDYLDGFYEGDTTRLVRSIRPEVFKYGFEWAKDRSRYEGEQMSWQEILGYARRFRAANRKTPATAPHRVQLLDVLDQTAAVKVIAWWGSDYLLLGKYDGRWMVSHVMWQSPPRP